MRELFNADLRAYLSLDDDERIRYIDHTLYWTSTRETPLQVSIDYIHQIADLLHVSTEQLKDMHQQVSYLYPMEQEVEYRLSEEKQIFNLTTVGFYQTYLNVPVWQAGFTVTMKNGPYRIVGAVNTSQEGLEAKLPAQQQIEYYRRLFNLAELQNVVRKLQMEEEKDRFVETTTFVRNLIDRRKLHKNRKAVRKGTRDRQDNARLIRGRFYVYRYNETDRLPVRPPQIATSKREGGKEESDFLSKSDYQPVLPLPPVDRKIKDGRYYLVGEVTFSFTTEEYGQTNWLALVEVETRSVLYLRALSASIDGHIFVYDPITTTGLTTNSSDQSNAVLNLLRKEATLANLDPPKDWKQSLNGKYVKVTNVEDPNIPAPDTTAGSDFYYDVRTNEFAAVNSYFHGDRFFRLVESLGIPLSTYFDKTEFPISIDHRGKYESTDGNEINAHCEGNGKGGIGYAGYCLSDTSSKEWRTKPIGIALDWRVHLHELGGHGVLYEHVDKANFGFAHSAGDSLAVILNDPQSNAPDRFESFPWINISTRRCDRDIATGWAWYGANYAPFKPSDPSGYQAEEILETTLFRAYRSIGGDSKDLIRQRFASRVMTFLILMAIHKLTPATNPTDPEGFVKELKKADAENWATEGISIFGGAYYKVLRWSFEMQGAYPRPGAPRPVTTPGDPEAIDVYIEDGRHEQYQYQSIHWNNTSIWNRKDPDGKPTHEPPVPGKLSYAYVRIRNRGTETATNIRIRGYHCRPSAGVVWPNDFQAFTTPELLAGPLRANDLDDKIVGPFEWTPIKNAYGHDCMLMIVSTENDPSNADNLIIGEFIPDWRLVPNDNNIGQRNVNFVPGAGGRKGLMGGLNGYSFWVKNSNLKTSTMELRVDLPELIASNGWHLSFKGISNNQFELQSGAQQEIFIELQPGKEFSKQDTEKSEDTDIVISTYSDDMLVGGITYRLDPEIKEPYSRAKLTNCNDKAQELLKCMDLSTHNVKKVSVKNITVDIELHDNDK